jgi:glycosyltransferase involved in cell wall biosynthesis
MIRVLFIARYRDATMDHKLVLMTQQGDYLIRQVRPRRWLDELIQVAQTTETRGSLQQVAVPMLGQIADPHRALYGTLDFGMLRFRPHIVHAEEEPDSLAALQISLARRLFAPKARLILYTWQNIDRPRHRVVRWVKEFVLCAADGVLCANREAQAILERGGYRGKTWVLPAIGVDTQTFRPCSDRPERDRFVVGYVGRLVPEKGVDTLIEAVRLLAEPVELRIVGDGPYRQILENLARERGLAERVRFDPPMPPAQVAGAMCQLDALVLPSRTTQVWKEQFGRVLVEAMACKVPIVGSDSGAIPEVIGDAGLIFPEGDAPALAECLRQLMESPDLRHEMAERGYERVMRSYTQVQIAQKTAEYYREISAST